MHSTSGSGPDVVEQVEVLMEIPEVIANERWRNNGKSIVININLDQWGRRDDNSPRLKNHHLHLLSDFHPHPSV